MADIIPRARASQIVGTWCHVFMSTAWSDVDVLLLGIEHGDWLEDSGGSTGAVLSLFEDLICASLEFRAVLHRFDNTGWEGRRKRRDAEQELL